MAVSGTLMPFPPGSGLKLGLLPEGHYTMVVFWTLNKYTVSNVLHIQPTLGCSQATGPTAVQSIQSIFDWC